MTINNQLICTPKFRNESYNIQYEYEKVNNFFKCYHSLSNDCVIKMIEFQNPNKFIGLPDRKGDSYCLDRNPSYNDKFVCHFVKFSKYYIKPFISLTALIRMSV